ncbi:MAG TPA: 30S ribosomal protein S20 [Firmicutes bacterium]|nr:30S ribosomal protein S20 [Bacillota bacterium]
MPRLPSSKKRLRQSEKRRLRNQAVKSRMRTFIKKARLAIESENEDEAKNQLRLAYSEIDVAARKGVIHKNQADRRKSRLARLFNKKFKKPGEETQEKT